MKMLLDTHAWIWNLSGSKKIGRKARRLLDKPSTEPYLSPVSVWEANLLARRRDFRLQGTFSEWLSRALLETPVVEAQLTFAVARRAVELRLPQPDLGDQFLLATAEVHDLVLLTADQQLLSQKWVQTIDASV